MAQKLSRPPLLRMARIHEELQNNRAPNCSSLSRLFEVSTKTVQRDIEFMRDQLGLPIEYDAGEHGYFYDGEVSSFPGLQVSEGEVLALFVAQKALVQYRGTPFEKPLQTAFEKLSASMGECVTVAPGALSEALSFRHTGVAKTDLKVFREVQQAVAGSLELVFSYQKVGDARLSERRVRPYHVACIDNQWYLFGYDVSRRAIRTFVIGRIGSVVRMGGAFERPADFSLAKHLNNAFGVFKGEGDYRVRIAFDAFATRLVRERTWHDSQVVREKEGGCIELVLRLDSLEEVERWILSWGSHARALGPPELKKRLREKVSDMSDIYAHAPEWFTELREMAVHEQNDRMLQWLYSVDQLDEDPNQLHFDLGHARMAAAVHRN